jgi:cholesterol transport system auxiliary component
MKGPHCVTAIVRKGLPLAAATLLAGCISFAPKPPPQLISLTSTSVAPAGDLAPGSTKPAIVVINPDSGPELSVTRVPVQVSGSGIAYIKGAIWIDRPVRQLREVIAETIRAKNNRLVFEGIDAATGGRPVLTSRLILLGYDAPSGSVIARLDAQLATPGSAPRLRRFEAKVPGVAADGKAIGPALNQAANDIAAQVADWVG